VFNFIDSGLEVAKTRFQTFLLGQKCVIQMEMSDSRIACMWNGARRSS